MAIITQIIPTQNFELIGNRIGEILFDELTNQFNLSGNANLNPGVWLERFTPFDPTEYPALVVKMGMDEFSNRDQKQVDGKIKFFIIVSTQGKSDADSPGDKKAALNLHRILGMCRAILSNPGYRTLGFAPGSILRVQVDSITVPKPDEIQDSLNTITGWLEFSVTVNELVELKTALPLLSTGAVVKLYETENGYKYDYGNDNGLFVDENPMPAWAIEYFISENGSDMPVIKFSELTDADALDPSSSFVGIIDNGDGTFTNTLYTYAQIAALVQGSNKKTITADADGATISDSFFSQPISYIITNNQTAIAGVNFTQDTDEQTITGIDISFFEGQVLIAFL